jgi:hypothetical protein
MVTSIVSVNVARKSKRLGMNRNDAEGDAIRSLYAEWVELLLVNLDHTSARR